MGSMATRNMTRKWIYLHALRAPSRRVWWDLWSVVGGLWSVGVGCGVCAAATATVGAIES